MNIYEGIICLTRKNLDPRFLDPVCNRRYRPRRAFDGHLSRLLKDRIVFIGTDITDHVANVVVAQLLFLRMEDPKKDVNIYINSVGGYVTAGLAILRYAPMDELQYQHLLHRTGLFDGSLPARCRNKGRRYALPNSRIMIHQPSGGVGGRAEDIRIQAKEILYIKKRLMRF